MKKLLLCFAIIFLLYTEIESCKKDNAVEMDTSNFWECNKVLGLDSAAVFNKLIGSWMWLQESCEGDTITDRTIKATFNSTGTYFVIENSDTTASGNWNIKPADTDTYELTLSEPSEYLYGRILFCSEQVLFNYSYVDGCNNLFSKNK